MTFRESVRSHCAIYVALCALASSATGLPRGSQQEFAVDVEIARLEVAIRDNDGTPIRELGRQDFAVSLGEHALEIVGVAEIDYGLADGPAYLGEAAADDVSADSLFRAELADDSPAPRSFVLLVDLTNMDARGVRYTRNAAIDFIEQAVSPWDHIAVAVYSPRRGLEVPVWLDARPDHAVGWLESFGPGRALERISSATEGLDLESFRDLGFGEIAEWEAQINGIQLAMSAEDLMSAISAVTEALARVPGSKHVVFFSRGLPDLALSEAGFRSELQEVTETSWARGVALHTLDPSALPGWDYHDVRQMQSSYRTAQGGDLLSLTLNALPTALPNRAVLAFLSGETGGQSHYYRHQLQGGLASIAETSRHRYVVGVRLRPEHAVGSADITVSYVGSQDDVSVDWWPISVAAAGGRDADSGDQRRLATSDALPLSTDIQDLAVEFDAQPRAWSPDRATLAVAMRLPHAEILRVAEESGNDSLDLEVLGLVVAGGRVVEDYFRGRLRLADTEALAQRQEDFVYTNELSAAPGTRYVKLVLRDADTGLMGSQTLRLDVPDHLEEALRATTPTIVSRTAPVVDGAAAQGDGGTDGIAGRSRSNPFGFGGESWAPVLGAAVVPGTAVSMMIDVYNVRPHPFTGKPEVSVAVEVGDGSRYVEVPLTSVQADAQEAPTDLRLLVAARWPDDAPCGELRVRIYDRITASSDVGTRLLTCE